MEELRNKYTGLFSTRLLCIQFYSYRAAVLMENKLMENNAEWWVFAKGQERAVWATGCCRDTPTPGLTRRW